MLKTILITGGGGFIGSHLVELLLENKYNVIILERSIESTGRIKKILDKVKVYYSQDGDTEKIFAHNKIDCVIHLAALYIKDHSSVLDVENTVDVNIKFPATLAELCIKYDVRYFINTGTLFEYGIIDSPAKESQQRAPLSLYAASKVASSELLKYYSRDRGLNVANMILFSPFGDGDNEKLFAFLIKSLIEGTAIEFSGGEQRWNFTYVKDIVLAYLSVLQNFSKISGYEDFNVGYDKTYSIKEIASGLEKLAAKKLMIKWGAKPYIKNEYLFFNCDNSKIKEILNWKPKYDFRYGLEKTYKYYFDYYAKEKNGR